MTFVVPFLAMYLPTFAFCSGVITIYSVCAFLHFSDSVLTSLCTFLIDVEGTVSLEGLEDQVNSFHANSLELTMMDAEVMHIAINKLTACARDA